MPEISHHQLSALLKKAAVPEKSVYLIHGEQALVEQCLDPLMDFLLQGASRDIHCESVDGLADNIADMLAGLNTYALMAGAKAVLFKDAKLFDTRGDQQRLMDQIREACEAERMESAAKAFLSLCRHLGLASADLAPGGGIAAELLPLQEILGEDALAGLIRLGRDKGWQADPSADPMAALIQGIDKGFPAGHYLVITSYSKVPKNRKLYKIIAERGWVIDCVVPLGEKKADKTAQETVLRQTLDDMLAAGGKRMAPGLLVKLMDLTGFDLPVFIQNLDKLIAYVGDRQEITAADVDALVRRTKQDPLFELTNAVADRDAPRAVTLLQGLLNADWHPLQILAALANQIRKLIVARDFSTSRYGMAWSAGMSYPQFQDRVLPAMHAFDNAVEEQMAAWDSEPATDDSGRKKKKGDSKNRFDLALAANPYNAYPIYQTLLKSEKFGMLELTSALKRTGEVDVRLKSSTQDPAAMLTALILAICGK